MPRSGGGQAYRLLYVCACAVAFVNAMTFSVLGPFLPAYITGRFGSSVTQVRNIWYSRVYEVLGFGGEGLFQENQF